LQPSGFAAHVIVRTHVRAFFLRLVLGIAPQLLERDSLRVTASSPLFVASSHTPGTSSIPYAHYLTSPVDVSQLPLEPISPASPSSAANPPASSPSKPTHKIAYSFASSALLGPDMTTASFPLAAANEEKKNLLGYRDEAKRVSQRLQGLSDLIGSWADPKVPPAISRADRSRLFTSVEQQEGFLT